MKKLALLLLTAVLAVGAQAAPQFKVARGHNAMTIKKEMTGKHKLVKGDQRMIAKAQAKAISTRDVITEQPEGQEVKYQRTGEAVYVSNGNIYKGNESGFVTMVYGENNKVYIQNLLYNAGSYFGDAWVEGTISEDGTTLSVPVGQSIYYSSQYDADVVIAWGTSAVGTNDEGSSVLNFTPDASVTEITYTIDPEAKTISLNNSEGDINGDGLTGYEATGIGTYWTDDNSFGGFVGWKTVFTEYDPSMAPTVISEQPEGTLYTYIRTGYSIANSYFSGITINPQEGKMNVVFSADGKKAYIQNPVWWHNSYNSWVEGDYDWNTGIISVPVGQYLYYNADYGYGIQIGWAKSSITEGDPDENGNATYNFAVEKLDVEAIEFMIDDDKIYLLNSKGDGTAEFPNNFDATGIYSYYSDDNSMTALEYGTEGTMFTAVPAVPADPTADNWYDCGDERGYSQFGFTLPTTDVDGNTIDQEFLSYSVYTDDDQIFNFDAENYSYDITEDMTEIPYYIYSNGYDFANYACYFYRTNRGDNPMFNKRIGIQVHYTVDGVKNSSNIVYLDVLNEFYLVGSFNDWKTEEGNGRIKFTEVEDGVYQAKVDMPAGAQFKVITPAEDGGWKWYGGTDETGVGYYEITQELLNTPTALFDGANFLMDNGAVYLIRISQQAEPTQGIAPKAIVNEPLQIEFVYYAPTAISTISSDNKVDNNWYNLQGQKLNGKPSVAGIYINGGKKVVIK